VEELPSNEDNLAVDDFSLSDLEAEQELSPEQESAGHWHLPV